MSTIEKTIWVYVQDITLIHTVRIALYVLGVVELELSITISDLRKRRNERGDGENGLA